MKVAKALAKALFVVVIIFLSVEGAFRIYELSTDVGFISRKKALQYNWINEMNQPLVQRGPISAVTFEEGKEYFSTSVGFYDELHDQWIWVPLKIDITHDHDH